MDKNTKSNLIIFVIFVLFGVILGIQLKNKVPSLAPVTLNSIEMAKNEIDNINKEIEELKKMLKDMENKIQIYENSAKENRDIIDLLNEELNRTKLISGFVDVKGPGIIVKMADNMSEEAVGQEFNLDIIHDADVLRIINDLKEAGAEAISINGQRVLSVSEIKCGGPIIRINGKSVGTPIYIKAIGDPKLLNAAINAPNTYGYALKTIDQLVIETEISDEIVIPAYSGNIELKYAKPIEEGD
jgi:uncharacterized protein YlxW (UPF0749 family)